MTVDIPARLAEVMPGIRRDLEDLVRIQSVSADPARAGEVERSAEATRDLFAAEGFECEVVRAHVGELIDRSDTAQALVAAITR